MGNFKPHIYSLVFGLFLILFEVPSLAVESSQNGASQSTLSFIEIFLNQATEVAPYVSKIVPNSKFKPDENDIQRWHFKTEISEITVSKVENKLSPLEQLQFSLRKKASEQAGLGSLPDNYLPRKIGSLGPVGFKSGKTEFSETDRIKFNRSFELVFLEQVLQPLYNKPELGRRLSDFIAQLLRLRLVEQRRKGSPDWNPDLSHQITNLLNQFLNMGFDARRADEMGALSHFYMLALAASIKSADDFMPILDFMIEQRQLMIEGPITEIMIQEQRLPPIQNDTLKMKAPINSAGSTRGLHFTFVLSLVMSELQKSFSDFNFRGSVTEAAVLSEQVPVAGSVVATLYHLLQTPPRSSGFTNDRYTKSPAWKLVPQPYEAARELDYSRGFSYKIGQNLTRFNSYFSGRSFWSLRTGGSMKERGFSHLGFKPKGSFSERRPFLSDVLKGTRPYCVGLIEDLD